jgi:hypothetical protein
MPTLEALARHRTDLEAKWSDMLGHQLPVLPPVGDFWDAGLLQGLASDNEIKC